MKKTVCVVFGGASSEYEISLMSSSSILRNLDTEKFDILTLGITKDGRWLLYSGGIDAIEDGTWVEHPENRTAFLSPDRSTAGLVVLEPDGTCSIRKIDVVFPVLHGKNGEDGTIQGLFQFSGIAGIISQMIDAIRLFQRVFYAAPPLPRTVAITDHNNFHSLPPIQSLSFSKAFPLWLIAFFSSAVS